MALSNNAEHNKHLFPLHLFNYLYLLLNTYKLLNAEMLLWVLVDGGCKWLRKGMSAVKSDYNQLQKHDTLA